MLIWLTKCLYSQLVIVYLGVALEDVNATTRQKVEKYCIIGAAFVVTILAAWYIYHKMNKARLTLYRARRAQIAEEKAGAVRMQSLPGHGVIDRSGSQINSMENLREGGVIGDGNMGRSDGAKSGNYQNPYDIRWVTVELTAV